MANQDFDLMRYHDGELDEPAEGDARRQLETDLKSDSRLAGHREGLVEVGELVRGHLELEADAAEPRLVAMWSEIEKRLENERRSPAIVVEEAPTPRPAPVGTRAGMRWFERVRSHVLTGALSAGAVAAVALLLRTNQPSGGGEVVVSGGAGRGIETVEVGSGGSPPIAIEPAVLRTPPQVELLDVTEGTGTVLTIEDEDGETAVIWVTPNDVVEGL